MIQEPFPSGENLLYHGRFEMSAGFPLERTRWAKSGWEGVDMPKCSKAVWSLKPLHRLEVACDLLVVRDGVVVNKLHLGVLKRGQLPRMILLNPKPKGFNPEFLQFVLRRLEVPAVNHEDRLGHRSSESTRPTLKQSQGAFLPFNCDGLLDRIFCDKSPPPVRDRCLKN